jgi:hypothetical protein
VLHNLVRGELGNGDDQIGVIGGMSGLFCKAGAKIGCAVFRRHHKEIVKCGDLFLESALRETLIQSMKNTVPWTPFVDQQAAVCIGRERLLKTLQKAVRPVIPVEWLVGVPFSESLQEFA